MPVTLSLLYNYFAGQIFVENNRNTYWYIQHPQNIYLAILNFLDFLFSFISSAECLRSRPLVLSPLKYSDVRFFFGTLCRFPGMPLRQQRISPCTTAQMPEWLPMLASYAVRCRAWYHWMEAALCYVVECYAMPCALSCWSSDRSPGGMRFRWGTVGLYLFAFDEWADGSAKRPIRMTTH